MDAVIYTRISIDRSGESEAPERQLEACRRYAEAKGWQIAAEHSDRDVSAFRRGAERPAFEAALEEVRSGRAGVLLAWRLDRVARRVADLAGLVDELRDLGASLVCVQDGVDTSTPTGALVASIIGAIAQMESESIRARTVARNEHDAAQGRYYRPGGVRAFGRERSGALVPAEADAIREAARFVLGGGSLAGAARMLNARGLRTTAGREWRASGVGRMLREPHIRGLRARNGEVLPGDFPAVLSEAEGLRVLARLDGHEAFPTGSERLLSGLVYCGACGQRMGHNTDRWRCRRGDGNGRCGRMSVAERLLDAEVEQRWRARARELVTGMAWEVERPASDMDGVRRALEADRQAQADLVHGRYVERTVPPAAYASAYLELEQRIAAHERELATARVEPEVRHLVLPVWLDAVADGGVEVSGDGVRRLVERVVVDAVGRSGNRWQGERVRVEWRVAD